MKLIAVVPAHNEEKNIGEVLDEIKKYTKNIIVVDDFSSDKTGKIAKKGGVNVQRHNINKGLGGALKTGINEAILDGADIIVTLDADGQHNPNEIPKIIEPIIKGEADFVVGSRFLIAQKIPIFRIIANKLANFITFIFWGIKCSDTQSGFRAFNREAAKKIKILSSRMEVSSEIIKEVKLNKLRIKEIPITAIYTPYSLSKGQGLFLGFKTFINLFLLKFSFFSVSFNEIYKDKRKLLFTIFLFSVIFSCIFLYFFKNVGPEGHMVPGTDFLNCYAPAAENILKGNLVLQKEGYVRCAIGYPLTILPAFLISVITGINRVILIIFFNVLITAASACLLYLIAESIFNKKIAIISSFLWLCYPLNLWFIKNPNTEVPFIFFMFLSIWIFLLALKNKKVWLFLISGIILGFSVLIRPIAVFLILFLLFGVFVLADKDKKINSVLNLFSGFLLIVLPWILLASFVAGHFVMISSIGSSTFLDGMRFGIKTGSEGDAVYIPNNVKDIMQKAQNSQITGEIDVLKFIFLEFARSPIAMLELLVFKLARSWYATSELWLEKEIFLIQLPYLLTAIFGLALVFKKNKEKFICAVPILLTIIYFWLITTATLSIARYTIPVMGFVIIFSAVSVDKIFEKFNIYEKIGFNNNPLSQ